MKDLKKQIEAILFSVGKYISLEEIARLCRKSEQKVKEALLSLMVDYEEDEDTALVLLNDGDRWKLSTREEYGHLVREVVSETELTKSQLETLAVIAFKYPIKQSDLIKIRTNKAYDHIKELEEAGFISRQKYGRSKLIKLTDKFFEYFDLPQEKLKERFKGFEDLAKTIEEKEEDIEKKREEQKRIAEETRKIEEQERKVRDGEVDLIDEVTGEEKQLQQYGEEQAEKEMLGDMEVVDDAVPPSDDAEESHDDEEDKQPEESEEDNKSDQREVEGSQDAQKQSPSEGVLREQEEPSEEDAKEKQDNDEEQAEELSDKEVEDLEALKKDDS